MSNPNSGYPNYAAAGHVQQPYQPQPGLPAQGTTTPHLDQTPEMPDKLKAVRIILFIFAGLTAIATAYAIYLASALTGAGLSSGLMYAVAGVALLLAVAELLIGLKIKNGGAGTRVAGIVWGVVNVAGGLYNLVHGNALGVVTIVIGGIVVNFLCHSSSIAWFKRPRY